MCNNTSANLNRLANYGVPSANIYIITRGEMVKFYISNMIASGKSISEIKSLVANPINTVNTKFTLPYFDLSPWLSSVYTGLFISNYSNVSPIVLNGDAVLSSSEITDDTLIYILSSGNFTINGTVYNVNVDNSAFKLDNITKTYGDIFSLGGMSFQWIGAGSVLLKRVSTTNSNSNVISFSLASKTSNSISIDYTPVVGSTFVELQITGPNGYADGVSIYSPFPSATFGGLLPSTTYTITVTDNLNNVSNPTSLVVTTNSVNGETAPCFFGNARVLTPNGYKRMDSLRAGDKVTAPSGKVVTVEAVKLTLVEASNETNPYVIEAGQFGCTKRLLISPEHKVATERGMVKARDLGLRQEAKEGIIEYYNLRLAGEEQMVVQGVPVESLAHVERIVMSRAEFERRVVAKYGRITPAIHAMIARTCRFLDGDRVECPAMRR
jgi:hypothetical protein